MNICVVGGAGYVGLITGIGLAQIGHKVINVDINHQRIEQLKSGKLPIHEPGLAEVLKHNLDSGRLSFTIDLSQAADASEIVFIAVGTPIGEDGGADLDAIFNVAKALEEVLTDYKIISIRSTIPVGCVESIREILGRQRSEGKDFDIVVNPEFLREGKGLSDFMTPDRIVIGTDSKRAKVIMEEVYEPILNRRASSFGGADNLEDNEPVPIVHTTPLSAQMIKYCSNAFLATRVSFINEVAGLCERVGADIKEVSNGVGYDPRIGHGYLEAGLGFGGPCIEKDLKALIKMSEDKGHNPMMLKGVLERNDKQIEAIVSKVDLLLGGSLSGKTIAALGLAFKSGTNDVRNSLSLKVLDRISQENVDLRVYDPKITPEDVDLGPNVVWGRDPYETAEKAHALLILTEWPSFVDLDYSRIKNQMSSPFLVDGRNLLDPNRMRNLGFGYSGVGIS